MSVHTEGAIRQCAAAMLTLAVVAENQRVENIHQARKNVGREFDEMVDVVMDDDR